jgi:hypothetical protein
MRALLLRLSLYMAGFIYCVPWGASALTKLSHFRRAVAKLFLIEPGNGLIFTAPISTHAAPDLSPAPT